MSAKMLLSLAEAPRVHEEPKHSEQDAQTAVNPQVELDSTSCEPREKVFNTTEILEGILECLPAKTLFVVQRVNKRFHETITNSPRIQRKMFLRIDNDHSIVWETCHMSDSTLRFSQVSAEAEHSNRVMTPIVHSPCLERVRRPSNPSYQAYLESGEALRISCFHTFSYEQFESQSIGKGYFSDPQCTTIHVKLCFKLGSKGFINAFSVVESNAPLTIQAVISRIMATQCRLGIIGAHCSHLPSGYASKLGAPREVIREIEDCTGLEVFFTPSESTFHLFHVVAPTDDERVAAKEGGDKRNALSVRL